MPTASASLCLRCTTGSAGADSCLSSGTEQVPRRGWRMTMRNATKARQVYDRYRALHLALTEKYRLRIQAADPRVGYDSAFHLAQNWGNAAAKLELARYVVVASALRKR